MNSSPSPYPLRYRWQRFKTHKRGYYSLWIFSILFFLSLFAEFLSNEKPLLIFYNYQYYFPIIQTYPETTFGGFFATEADYTDAFIREQLTHADNWMIETPNPYSFNTLNYTTATPNPAPPSDTHLLGTDDHGRDVLARLIYGFRLSVLFGLTLMFIAVFIGILAGAIQGYFGGRIDLYSQRLIEIWTSIPELYVLIIFSSLFHPSILLLIVLLSLFGWISLADYVRAEFLKGRNFTYIYAAQALGVGHFKIIWRHLLPNAMTPVLTYIPFFISRAVLALTSLDFLGLGLPPTEPSLGNLLAQGKNNIEAWWLSLFTFIVLVSMLVLLAFIGESLRETFNARKS
ncbi:ABC transporter permease [Beggiatoa leptomitoformis]|uniref:ABC transporter permease subunit n=1 Tax=Beggiatoa leptomitoformis TaxID=288004 RepID=A0A2N9YDH9_9GAMM|nr:ABC transporter permease [Beggiatoa leptomitoformis]ALG69050.1 ABC transporter permease subunit [Beggiatoa leptomitoformis]AUI68541.1 ABC transporter permease subunit [Beggiatoa leptomitoformis]